MQRLTGAGVIPAISKPTPPRGLVKEEPLELPLPLEIAIVVGIFGIGVGIGSVVKCLYECVCVMSDCQNRGQFRKLYM